MAWFGALMFLGSLPVGLTDDLPEPTQYEVAWVMPSDSEPGDDVGEGKRLSVDTDSVVTFAWNDPMYLHDLMSLTSEQALTDCDFTDAVELVAQVRTLNHTLDLGDGPKTIYLSCSNGIGHSHCQAGQKLIVEVGGGQPEPPCKYEVAWVMPSDNEPGDDVGEGKRLNVDTDSVVTFAWSSPMYLHNLMSLTSEQALTDCNFTDAVELVAEVRTVNHTLDLGDGPKTLYLSCSVGLGNSHCQNGQKLIVEVGGGNQTPCTNPGPTEDLANTPANTVSGSIGSQLGWLALMAAGTAVLSAWAA